MRPALFLDRDGVINEDKGYVHRIEDFVWRAGIFDIARAARAHGHAIVVVTNQSGIGRGYYLEEDYRVLTDWMCARFAFEGAPLTGVYHCPYHPEAVVAHYKVDHPWRKPKPGMILAAAADHALDLPRSTLIGDNESDIQAAAAAGLGAACLVSAEPAEAKMAGLVMMPDVVAAASWYLASLQRPGQRLFPDD